MFGSKNDTLRLFSRKNFFCVSKGDVVEKCIEFSFFFNKLASRLSLCQYLSIYFLSMQIYVFY